MAKKKKPAARDGRVSVTNLKGSREWSEWVGRLAEFDRNTVAGLLDRALAEYALNHHFKEAPPRR